MANISETSTYESGIFQLETNTRVLGGVGGPSNTQASQLANRTKYLKNHVDALETAPTITGTGGSGYLGAIPQSSTPSTPASGFKLFADSTGKLSWVGTNGYVRTFDGTSNTADRTYTLPDTSGKMILKETIGQEIAAATAKTTLVDGDIIAGADSASSFSFIKSTALAIYNYIVGKLSVAGYIYYATDTFANLSALAGVPTGAIAKCTDVGYSTTPMIYTGLSWCIIGNQTIHDRMWLSVFIAPTFTGTTNGSITFGTAFGSSNAQCYVYYDANTLVSGQAAGFYFTIMSSTTNATAYNNVYVPAAGTHPAYPSPLIAFSGSVPGGAGKSGVEITAYIAKTIPGGLLGYYGAIISRYNFECVNNANSKTARIKLGGTTLGSTTVGAATAFGGQHMFQNMGSPGYQRGQGVLLNVNTTGLPTVGLINTANNQNISVTLQTNNAADWIGVAFYDLQISTLG